MSESLLLGSWKLISFEVEVRGLEARQRPFGMNPNGYLILGPDGRMMALLTGTGRVAGQKDGDIAALFRTMMSYTGRYRIDNDRFITKVDASWNESWNGGDQVRFWKMDGNNLVIKNQWAPSATVPGAPMAQATATWRRE
jgi:hypothetical protein